MKPFENSTFIRTTMQIQSQGPSAGLQASLPHLRVRFDSFSEEEEKLFLCQLSRDPSRGGVFCFIAVLQLGVVRNSMAPLETRETFA